MLSTNTLCMLHLEGSHLEVSRSSYWTPGAPRNLSCRTPPPFRAGQGRKIAECTGSEEQLWQRHERQNEEQQELGVSDRKPTSARGASAEARRA